MPIQEGMPADDFASILASAQAGAEAGIAALYRRHHANVLRYLGAQEPQDAADIAADTWLDVARNLHRFRGDEDGFSGWVFTIARRRLIDHRRGRRRRPVEPLATTEATSPAVESAEQAALGGPMGDAEVRRIVALLPPDQAEVVLLRVVGDLEVEAVARITGRRPGTVRVIQHRALRRLAAALNESTDPGNAGAPAGDGGERDAHAPTYRPR